MAFFLRERFSAFGSIGLACKETVSPCSSKRALFTLWGLQWRMLASWAGGYGMVFLAAPILYLTSKPELAGTIGMTFQVLQSLAGMALIPLTVRIPLLAQLFRTSSAEQVNKKIQNIRIKTLLLFMLLVCVLSLVYPFLDVISDELLDRLPPFRLFFLYSIAFLCCMYLYIEAARFRSEAKELFWYVYLVGAFVHVMVLAVVDDLFLGALVLILMDWLTMYMLVRRISFRQSEKQ